MPSGSSDSPLVKFLHLFGHSSSRERANSGRIPSAPYHPPTRGLRAGDGEGADRVFGVKLEQSLKYASVAISMVGQNGKPQVFGYVPVVVAKCGLYLKETAQNTEGIFRVSGSNRRINELQAIFDLPPRYGKDLDWAGYSPHDAASVLRRFLNSMPEPVIPQDLYRNFTAVLQSSQSLDHSISAYRKLIALLPPTSRYLLLYLLDFLSVFARSADKNLMTSSNLAVVFQPALVSTRETASSGALLGFPGFEGGKVPDGGSAAAASTSAREGAEHGRAKEVLEFLIEQQSHFMLGAESPVDKNEDPYSSGVTRSNGLERRASERSVNGGRKLVRKPNDGSNAKVKRSRTYPGKSSENPPIEPSTRSTAPTAAPLSSDTANIHSTPLTTTPEIARKPKRSSTATPAWLLPQGTDSVMRSPKEESSSKGGWWKPRRSSEV